MLIYFKKLLLLFLILMTSSAFATRDVGNGGTVYVCPEGVYLVDTKEQEFLNYPGKIKLEFPTEIESTRIHLLEIFYLISKVDSQLGNEISKDFSSLLAMLNYTGPLYSWNLTPDVGSVPVPTGCELQNVFMFRSKNWMEVNESLFNQMSKIDQVGLYLHEIIYQRIFKITKKASAPLARKITAALMATNLSPSFKADLIRYTLIRDPWMTNAFLVTKNEETRLGDTGLLMLEPSLQSKYAVWNVQFEGEGVSGKKITQDEMISLYDLNPNKSIKVTFEISAIGEFASEDHLRAQQDIFRWNIVNYKNRHVQDYKNPKHYLSLIKRHKNKDYVSNTIYELNSISPNLNPFYSYYKRTNESILAGEITIAPRNEEIESYLDLTEEE